MIKLRIENEFMQEEKEYIEAGKPENWYHRDLPFLGLEDYDKEKWKDGKEYEFNSLKELQEFVDTLNLKWTEDFMRYNNGTWDWYEIDDILYICKDEDNLMILDIGYHEEWRD